MGGNKKFDPNTYFRVGTAYYKVVWWPLISGDSVKVLIPWSRQAIIQDYGGKVLNEIKSYDGFCNIPSHTSFEAVVNNFLNRYEHIPHKPVKGQFNNTEKFLKHIFQGQYDLGLDYLKILYLKPTQALPVFCLVSKERGTGKTTFLNYLKLIFGPNMTYNKNEDFRSQFNSDWAGKLIIAVDEVLLDKREDSERIKNLSTAKTFKSEAKGKDRSEVEFFGKFILCSNNEDNFIQIDPGETRYWVIKVPVLEHEEVNMLYKLKSEIAAFLYHLKERKIFSDQKSRMWFDHKLLKTEALNRVIFKNKSRIEIELLQIISDLMDEFNLSEVKFCLKDPLPFLRNSGVSYCKSTDVKEVFQNWGLTPEKNSNSYTRYSHTKDGISYPISGQKGRYYTITKTFVDEKMNIDDS